MKKPLLTVCVITYNHKQYIRECLDTILMQELDVPWQIVVADDCSTDGTRDILKEYQRKYPERIHLILQKKNVGAEQNWFDLLAYPKSKYISYTEGDDYFTDSTKLQRQLDFLESHSDYALCFHPVRVVFQNKEEEDSIHPTDKSGFTLKKLLTYNYIQTNSVMYRRQDYSNLPTDIIPGDWYFHLYHAQFGKIGFIDRVMSVYRKHSGGAWWDAYKNRSSLWVKYADKYLAFLHEVMLLYGTNNEYKKIILSNMASVYDAMVVLAPQEIDDTAARAIARTPYETWDSIKNLKGQVEEQISITYNKEVTINALTTELAIIKSSKAWKGVKVLGFVKNFYKHPVKNTGKIIGRILGKRTS